MAKVVSVFTFKSVDTILSVGGTQSWVLNRSNASACKYVVCCRNAHSDATEGDEPHGSAFLVGRVRDVLPSTETPGRWMIQMSEYAVFDEPVPDQHRGRAPVRYYDEEAYKGDIDFGKLKWLPMPSQNADKLTIAGAKAALSASLGVPETAIEITIKL